jgi:membrane protein required for colicin V production
MMTSLGMPQDSRLRAGGFGVAPVDLLAATVVGIALLRGLFLGLVREAFSLGSIAAAVIAVRFFAASIGDWLVRVSDGSIGPTIAPWIAGAALVVISIAAIGMAGRWIRRGVSAAGFSWADRAGGGVLGAAEGALLVVVVVGLATTFLGRDHESVRGSHSLAALERLESMARERDIDVSAPPLSF